MKRLSVIALCAAALVLSLSLCACGSSSGSSASSAASSSAESSASAASSSSEASDVSSSAASSESSAAAQSSESASASSASSEASAASSSAAQSASASAASTASEVSSNAAAGFDFVDECTDEHGNVTLYSLTELKGWQLETLLDQQGYKWEAPQYMWRRTEDGASFAAIKETGPYTQETYNEMNEKGGAIVAIGLHVVAGYKDSQEALKGNAKCVVEDSYFNGSDGIAIFYGPSMKEYLTLISKYTESTTLFMIFSQEAIGSGMADEYLGTHVGGSFQEVWKSVTGKDSYGH